MNTAEWKRAGWFAAGFVAALLAIAALFFIFRAYLAPEFLVDWLNLRYCG